jgi:hypothetical protein
MSTRHGERCAADGMMRSCWDQVSFAGEINADEYDVLGNKLLT